MSDSQVDRIHRVAYVDTDRSLQEIDAFFSQCGSIRAIYPWKTGRDTCQTHFFIEFDDKNSVKRARAAQLPNSKVHVLAFSPQLIAHYSSIAQPNPDAHTAASNAVESDTSLTGASDGYAPMKRPKRTHPPSMRAAERRKANRNVRRRSSSNGSSQYKKTKRASKEASWSAPPPREPRSHHSRSFSMSEKENHYTILPPMRLHSISQSPTGPASALVQIPTCPSPTTSINSSRATSPNRTYPVPDQEHTISDTPSVVPVPQPTLVPVVPSLNNGEQCTLDTLTEDPQAVISILTQMAAHPLERDKWMVVAGHYRGQGNVEAALAVVSAMLHVMTSPAIGMDESELRPALLLLSSCHTDLGKRDRFLHGEDAESTREHFRLSQAYLQKVYGALSPVDTASTTVSSYLLNDSKIQAPVTDVLQSQIDDLEREVRLLRDRNSSNMAYLSQSRSSKRKLEEELDVERRARRKAYTEVDDLKHQLTSTRRGEHHALEQCKREVDSRRRAEEKLKEAEGVMDRMATAVRDAGRRDKRARECFGRLGILFLRAAKGEAGVTPSDLGINEADFAMDGEVCRSIGAE